MELEHQQSTAPPIVYRDIRQRVRSGAYSYRYDEQQKAPYAISGSLWVGYDYVRSVTEKANYIKNNGLGGAMFWAIDNDEGSFL
jgi:chitinase